jgi:hypothetical protein
MAGILEFFGTVWAHHFPAIWKECVFKVRGSVMRSGAGPLQLGSTFNRREAR